VGVKVCPAERATGSERGDSFAAVRTVSGMHEVRMVGEALAQLNRSAVASKNLLIAAVAGQSNYREASPAVGS